MTAAPVLPSVPDPFRAGIEAGWKVTDAALLDRDVELEADVVIVGSGAGGGVAAEILANAGLAVILVEEGPLRSSRDFRMREADAYPTLYQESAARKTRDKAINILQGRCVGGGTTVNWTTSFRTPQSTLNHWATAHGLAGFGSADLAPWFEKMEARLSIAPWKVPPNANNSVLARGARSLGLPVGVMPRNVKGCWDLGYCGVGCPINAKQSMLVTTLPAALAKGATLLTSARALEFRQERDRVVALSCAAMDAAGVIAGPRRITLRARSFVSAAGGIGSPALLLKSRVPDPQQLIGKRTFLHPTLVCAAVMPERIEPWAGTPQSIHSDHFLDSLAPTGPIGYKLEVPPVHPILAAITLPNHGSAHAALMRDLPHLSVMLALLRDGFHPESTGGTVTLRSDDSPVLDYPLSPYLWDGVRRAFTSMAEIQFAAGATRVIPVHGNGAAYTQWPAARRAIADFDLRPLVTPVVSAHVMGGCPLGNDARTSVVDADGRHHHLANLHVFDGSLFPTSIGANPQLSIFAIVARLATSLAASLAKPKA